MQSIPHQVFEGYPQLKRQCQRSVRPSASLVSRHTSPPKDAVVPARDAPEGYLDALPKLASSSKMLGFKIQIAFSDANVSQM